MQVHWGGHNVKEILTWHPTVPPCTTSTGKPQGHNGFGTTLLMPPNPGGVLFLQPGLEIWCLTTWSTIYYKTCLKTTGLVVLVVYPLCNGALFWGFLLCHPNLPRVSPSTVKPRSRDCALLHSGLYATPYACLHTPLGMVVVVHFGWDGLYEQQSVLNSAGYFHCQQ